MWIVNVLGVDGLRPPWVMEWNSRLNLPKHMIREWDEVGL